MEVEATVKPFLKWAGGKRWLLSGHNSIFPSTFKNYYEPFLGSGAAFFFLQPNKAILADKNASLIKTYEAIKKDWHKVIIHLNEHHINHSSEYYYKIRKQNPRGIYSAAARFIYLNRTCWNGLYRVNLKGQFNVPIGTKNSVILPGDDFESVALLLQGAEILRSDFEEIIDRAGEDDFVYIDPPYTINHSDNGFIKYNDELFSWPDQIRLKEASMRAVKRGAKVIISNAHHETIEDLYNGSFELYELSRFSKISGKNSGRKLGKEYLIFGGFDDRQ